MDITPVLLLSDWVLPTVVAINVATTVFYFLTSRTLKKNQAVLDAIYLHEENEKARKTKYQKPGLYLV